MVDPGHPGAPSLGAHEWAELNQSYDAESVTAPRLQHLGQLGVVDPPAHQGNADILGDVEVTEWHGVGVSQGSRADLRSGPYADSGNAAQAAIDRGSIERR